jgi:hypothetical protein
MSSQTFTPSASVTYTAGPSPSAITLPPVDAGNQTVVIANSGPGAIAILAGSVQPSVFGCAGAIQVPAGGVVVIGTLAGFTAGTVVAVQAHPPSSASFRVLRGTMAESWQFPATVPVL